MQKISLFLFSILLPLMSVAVEPSKKFSMAEIRLLLLSDAMYHMENSEDAVDQMAVKCAEEDADQCAQLKEFLISAMRKGQEGLINFRTEKALQYPVESSTSRVGSWCSKQFFGFEERFKEHAFKLDIIDEQYPEKFKQCFGENDSSACYFIAQLMKDKIAQHYEPVADGIIEILKKK